MSGEERIVKIKTETKTYYQHAQSVSHSTERNQTRHPSTSLLKQKRKKKMLQTFFTISPATTYLSIPCPGYYNTYSPPLPYHLSTPSHLKMQLNTCKTSLLGSTSAKISTLHPSNHLPPQPSSSCRLLRANHRFLRFISIPTPCPQHISRPE